MIPFVNSTCVCTVGSESDTCGENQTLNDRQKLETKAEIKSCHKILITRFIAKN